MKNLNKNGKKKRGYKVLNNEVNEIWVSNLPGCKHVNKEYPIYKDDDIVSSVNVRPISDNKVKITETFVEDNSQQIYFFELNGLLEILEILDLLFEARRIANIINKKIPANEWLSLNLPDITIHYRNRIIDLLNIPLTLDGSLEIQEYIADLLIDFEDGYISLYDLIYEIRSILNKIPKYEMK